MKIVHAADLHLGRSRKLPNYLERQDAMVRGIFDLAAANDGIVLLAGDIFDRLDLLPRERDIFIRHLCRADAQGITTVMVNGNHDMIDEDDGGYTHLRVISAMVEEKRLKRTVVIETDPASFELPKLGFAVIGVPSYYRKTKEVNKIVAHHCKELATKLPVVALVHETVLGSRNDFGKKFGIDIGSEDHCVTLDPNLPVTYWALGDIHAPQAIEGCQHAWYSGAPIQHDFGDAPRRGVLVVDLDNPTDPQHCTLDGVTPLVTVRVSDQTTNASLEVPENAVVRVEGPRDVIASLTLPKNVVTTKPTHEVEAEIETIFRSEDPLEGLAGVLAEMGCSDKDQTFLLEEAERLRG